MHNNFRIMYIFLGKDNSEVDPRRSLVKSRRNVMYGNWNMTIINMFIRLFVLDQKIDQSQLLYRNRKIISFSTYA